MIIAIIRVVFRWFLAFAPCLLAHLKRTKS